MDNGLKINSKPRIEVIDSIRGFAIAAIFLIHTSNHFLFNSFPAEQSSLDNSIREVLYFIFEGKAYTIFALLFGFTFALQMDSYKRRTGEDFGGRMLWRLVLLIVIGVANAALFAGGDPLVFYALTMMLVLPLRNLSNGVITTLAIIFLAQPIELLNSIFNWYNTEGYIKEYVALNSVMVEGNMLETLWTGATIGLKGCLRWAIDTGRFTQTLGLFLLGILAYRHQAFSDKARWSRYFIVYICIAAVLYNFGSLRNYYNLLIALSLSSIFVCCHRWSGGRGIFKELAYYGRMSLTNFVMQSLLGALLYYPWALDLGGYLGVTYSIVITIALISLQILFSHWWLSRHRHGILEGIWHKLTYL